MGCIYKGEACIVGKGYCDMDESPRWLGNILDFRSELNAIKKNICP